MIVVIVMVDQILLLRARSLSCCSQMSLTMIAVHTIVMLCGSIVDIIGVGRNSGSIT